MPITRPDLNEQAMLRLTEALGSRRMFSMTGAGLSAWAGYPLWPALLDRLQARVREVRDREVDVDLIRTRYQHSPLEIAQKLGHELGNEFLPFLRGQFGPAGGRILSQVLLQFASLPFQQHLTLNYDDSLERAHPNGLLGCSSVTAANKEDLIEFLERSDEPEYGKRVLHCHGLYSDPLENLILTESGYAAVYQDYPLLTSLYWSLLSTRRVLFGGFGFTDKDFLHTLNAWKRDTRVRAGHLRHFAIYGLRDTDNDEAERARMRSDYRIEPIFYEVLPGHDHSGFEDIVSTLTQELGTFTPPRPALPGAVLPEDLDAGDEARVEELVVNMANRTGGGLPNV